MPKYPQPCVGTFIRNKKSEILLINSYKWGGKIWNVPGGHIDHDEIQKAGWFSLKEALEQNLDQWTRKSIKLLLKEKNEILH